MTEPPTIEERIHNQVVQALKEYTACDRTLDALAALSFALTSVKEMVAETTLLDFRPRLEATSLDQQPYTPDGLILQRPSHQFLLELKSSWNEKDVAQVIKYGLSQKFIRRDGTELSLERNRCLLVGYQNPPGERNLDKLFDAWDANCSGSSLVIFRYSLEQAAEGDRIFFSRLPYGRNGVCPSSSLGKAIDSVRGFPVSVDKLKLHRARFHKAGDEVIASYAAVLWWTTYALHYLSEEQRVEMAEKGRLSTPLSIPLDRVDQIPDLPGVVVPLGPKDVRRALEFLRQANLVTLKKRKGTFEIHLKEDRFIRLPHINLPGYTRSQIDLSTKIIVRWATNKIKKPIEKLQKKVPKKPRKRGPRDKLTGWLFPAS